MNLLIVLNWRYGIAKPFSPMFCPDVYKVGDQIKKVAPFFESCFIINDKHTTGGHYSDNELKYFPPHAHNAIECNTLDFALYDSARRPERLYKGDLNPFWNDHNRDMLFKLKPENVLVSGFVGSIDIIPTCLALIDLGQQVYVHNECIGDLSFRHKDMTLQYLSFMGIPILNGDINDKSFGLFKKPTLTARSVS